MNENRIYKGIIIIAVVVVLAIMYQHYVVLPEKQLEAEREQAALDRKAALEAEERRERKLAECEYEAAAIYSANWDAQCRLMGRENDCSLPRYAAEGIDADYGEAKDRCVDLYRGS